MSSGFIKLMRAPVVAELITYQPKAFLLLTVIAYRARRVGEKCRFTGLETGQAMIGDYRSCGLTHQEYRTAKQQLQSNSLATFKTTNKGTIATLCNVDVYDINCEQDNNQNNADLTGRQQADNKQITTNKNDKKEKNDKKTSIERFSKPTVEEVAAYVAETMKAGKPEIDAEDFVNFYESKGWLIGKTPMKSWKHAVGTWQKKRLKDEKESKSFEPPTIHKSAEEFWN